MVMKLKTLYAGDHLVQSIIGTKQVKPETVYRWSVFTVPHTFDNQTYLYQNFTKKLIKPEEDAVNYRQDARYTAQDINENAALQQLVADYFLVPEDTDETKVYENYCKVARALTKKEGYVGFTILPTTSCNARCVYCYEEGIEFVTMNQETVQQTVSFIKQVARPGETLSFSWFGGEPLIGEKYIDVICDAMREADIPFKSRITTNGSLITSDTVRKMKERWNLRHIQITLDGVEEEYNRRKNYYFNYDSAYWHILSRIKMVNENGIFLTIRVNVDMGNIDGVPQMIEDLKNFIVNPKIIRFDLAPLFDLQASEGGIEIWKRSFEMAQWIIDQGFSVANHHPTRKTKIHFCMADNPYRALVIAPDGKLYNCENIRSFDTIGDVWNGITNTAYLEGLQAVEPAREMCKGCFALPYCTTFSRCGHPRVDCKYAARKRLERALDNDIKYYQLHPQAQPEDMSEEDENDADC